MFLVKKMEIQQVFVVAVVVQINLSILEMFQHLLQHLFFVLQEIVEQLMMIPVPMKQLILGVNLQLLIALVNLVLL